MTPIRLSLLGPPELVRSGQQAVFTTRKALALLAYLAVEDGPHPREEVADLLWPAAAAEDARSSLRTSIRHVRSALGDAADSVLLATRDSVGLVPLAPLDLDIDLLSQAQRQIRAPGAGRGLRGEVEQAISAYRGPFLGDLSVSDAPEFDAWLAGQRAHWLGVVSELMDWLSTVQLDADDMGAALQTLERWVSLDPDEDSAWQRLIELHLAQGNRLGARHAWSAYRRARADLGIDVSPQLETLGAQVETNLQPAHAGYPLGVAPGVLGEPPAPEETDLVRTPFVGRARELMQLRRAFERARGGEPQLVVLEGEAGIGKTRLGEEFLTWAAIQGADVLRGRGFATTGDLPFATLVDSLRDRLERENAPDDLLDDVWLAELSWLLPELRVRYPDLPPPTSDPALGHHQLFEAVTRLLKAFADRRPLVVFRDDWDSSATYSRDLVRYALRRWSQDHDRVLLILAVSVEQLGTDRALAQWMGSLDRDAPTTHLALERLAAPDIGLWMAALAGTYGEACAADDAAMRLGEWLAESTAGNPSQIVASLRSLLEQQVLAFRPSDDGSWLLDLSELSQQTASFPPSVASIGIAVPDRHQDWGDAPDGRQLYGRRAELDELERWVVRDRCREVAVLGIGGIGKTALAARLARDVAPHFEFVFCRSLRNALPFDDWLAEAVRTLSEQQQVILPDSQDARVLLLLDLLRAHRCLLVLDNLETVLQPGQHEGRYLGGYAPYGLLLRRLAEVEHQSCLLLTSREKPREMALLEGEDSLVRSFELTGLNAQAGRALLERESLVGADADWQALVERYAGNPLALQVVSETVGDVFAGDIAAFLEEGEAIYGDIRRLLDAQVNRLSDLEQSLLYWLAIEREPVGLVELFSNLEPPATRGEVLEAVEGVRRRSLLERGRQGGVFTLQPVVLEYVTNRLVSAAVREIQDGDLTLLRTHALSRAQCKSYIRQSQERLIMAPLLERLVTVYGDEERVERHLVDLLEELRFQNRRDYGPGNMIKLLQLSRGNLRGLDLSHLFIRQAYLQEVEAQDAILAGSELFECALADAFDCGFSVAFSPDGRKLAAGTFNGEVCVWRLGDLTRLIAKQGHKGAVYGIDWASDGHLLATGALDGMVKLWEVTQGVPGGRLLLSLEGHTGAVWRVSFCADSHLLASASLDGSVKLWETSSGRLLQTLTGHKGAVRGVAVSSDGGLVASAGVDGTVKLWEAASGVLLSTLDVHAGGAYAVAFTPDGRLVAGAGQDGVIKVWEVTSGRLVSTLEGHTQEIWRLAMSADGHLMVSGSQDGTIRLWDLTQRVPGGVCLTALDTHAVHLSDVAISADARRFASVSQDGTIKLWEVPTGRLVTTLQGYARGTWGLAWDGSGQLLASGTQDGTINLWDVPTGALHAALHGHTGMVLGTALSEDGRLLVSGSADNTIRFWDVADGVSSRTLQADIGIVFDVVLSCDARLLISSHQHGLIKLWDVSTGDPPGTPWVTLQAHTNLIWNIDLSADGHLLASGSQDGTVKLWKIPSGRLLATIRDNGDLFWGLALSQAGDLVASGGQSGRVTLWEVTQASGGVPGGKLLATLGAHEGPVWGMAFSRDARLLISGGVDGVIMFWDVATRQLITRLTGHVGPITDVAVSPDGSLIASSSQDGAVMLWDPESGACRATLRPDRRYERMDITGLSGVSDVQKMVLKTLGAVEGETAPVTTPAAARVSSPPATTAAQAAASGLEPESLPSALERPPTNVPAPPTTFVGRSTALAALIRPLDPAVGTGARLLTLTGVAGSGKTRLALAVAEALRDAYRDGVWFVDLSPLPASIDANMTMVVRATLAALDLKEQAGQEMLDTLIASLRPKRLLLVLDNCEHVAAAAAALTERLLGACPELRVLATSQQALREMRETVWPVEPLAVPPAPTDAQPSEDLHRLEQSDAVALFVERAQAVRPGFALTASNAGLVAAICRRLDGLPLAIELAAARLNVLTLEDLLTRLNDRFRLLRHGRHTASDRHRALQATMDWSYGLLDPGEQAVLRRIAVFAGGWDLGAAEAVCADDQERHGGSKPGAVHAQGDAVEADAVLELLDELQDRSLVYATVVDETPRYRMLETVRQYGLQQLHLMGETSTVRDRHLEWCVSLAQQARSALLGPEQALSLARLDREHDNLRAGLQWALDRGLIGLGLQVAAGLWQFWRNRGYLSEGRHWFAALLARALEDDDVSMSMRASALEGAAWLAQDDFDFVQASTLFAESTGVRRALGQNEQPVGSLINAAMEARASGDYARAIALLEESLAQHRALGDHDNIIHGDLGLARSPAYHYTLLALVLREQGQFLRATALLEERLALFRKLGDAEGIGTLLLGLCDIARDQGDTARVKEFGDESLTIFRELGLNWAIGFALNNLALAAYLEDDLPQAARLAEESEAIFRSVQSWLSLPEVLITVGRVRGAQGDVEAARAALTEALTLAWEKGPRWVVAAALEALGVEAVRHAREQHGVQWLAAAAGLRETIGVPVRPADRSDLDHALETARTALGQPAFASAWTKGRAVPLEQAVSDALPE